MPTVQSDGGKSLNEGLSCQVIRICVKLTEINNMVHMFILNSCLAYIYRLQVQYLELKIGVGSRQFQTGCFIQFSLGFFPITIIRIYFPVFKVQNDYISISFNTTALK